MDRRTMTDSSSSPDSGVAAVDRALAILGAFRDEDHALSLARLAERTGLYKSTILRLADSLLRAEYLRRLPDGNYQVGAAPLRLASLFQRQSRTSDLVPPVLRDVVDHTGECASFYIREGDSGVCLHRVDCSRMVRDTIREGDRLPIDKGAACHVLRAFQGDLGSKLDQVRVDGYCASFGEYDPEIAAVSVPVLGQRQQLVGALTISGPRYRFGEDSVERMLPFLATAARKLTSDFGGDAEWLAQLG
jgi:DNA-binding IclR family transcriptional regulator